MLQVAGQKRRLRIVGVVENRTAGLGAYQARDDGSFVYQMMPEALNGHVLVRFAGHEEQFKPLLQSVLKERRGMIVPVASLRSRIAESLTTLGRIRTLLLVLGVIGLSLALVGVFGIVSFSAARQRRDFAVHVALGARPASIFRRVLAEGIRPILIALFPGALLSFAVLKVSESMRAFPMGLASEDPVPYAAAGLILILAGLAALVSPACRAGVSSPLRALREE
jgi:ABC-type antimicrobial peptide transport system permease subunit